MLVGEAVRDVCPGLGSFHIRISSDLFMSPQFCSWDLFDKLWQQWQEKEAEQANFASWCPIYLSQHGGFLLDVFMWV